MFPGILAPPPPRARRALPAPPFSSCDTPATPTKMSAGYLPGTSSLNHLCASQVTCSSGREAGHGEKTRRTYTAKAPRRLSTQGDVGRRLHRPTAQPPVFMHLARRTNSRCPLLALVNAAFCKNEATAVIAQPAVWRRRKQGATVRRSGGARQRGPEPGAETACRARKRLAGCVQLGHDITGPETQCVFQ